MASHRGGGVWGGANWADNDFWYCISSVKEDVKTYIMNNHCVISNYNSLFIQHDVTENNTQTAGSSESVSVNVT
jgi:hypothetical protein